MFLSSTAAQTVSRATWASAQSFWKMNILLFLKYSEFMEEALHQQNISIILTIDFDRWFYEMDFCSPESRDKHCVYTTISIASLMTSLNHGPFQMCLNSELHSFINLKGSYLQKIVDIRSLLIELWQKIQGHVFFGPRCGTT